MVQAPIDGTSFAYLLDDDATPGRHTTQYFEMFGSRGLYHDGWKAVTFKPLGPMYDDGLDPDAPFEDDVWELYRVADDRPECHDVAAETRSCWKELVDLWWEQAERYKVLPLDNRPLAALLEPRRPYDTRSRYVFWPNGAPVPETVTVNVRNRSHVVVADVEVPDGSSALEGVLLAMGTTLGGWSFHVLDGRLRYAHNYVGKVCAVVESDEVVAPGPARARHVIFRDRRRLPRQPQLLHRRAGGGDRRDRAPHARSPLAHRRWHHLRMGAGSVGRAGLHRAVPVHRHAAPRRRRRERRAVPRSRGRVRSDHVGAIAP